MGEERGEEMGECACGYFGSAEWGGLCSRCYRESRTAVNGTPCPIVGCTFYSSPANAGLCSRCFLAMNEAWTGDGPTLPSTSAATSTGDGATLPSTSADTITSFPDVTDYSFPSMSQDSLPDTTLVDKTEDSLDRTVYSCSASEGDDVTAAGSVEEKAARRVKKSGPERCGKCEKRMGPAAVFDCRCGGRFCSEHRYAEAHTCPFDYRALGRQELTIALPKITTPKVHTV